jgi:spermidine/putrescine transport system substrate-binding protein
MTKYDPKKATLDLVRAAQISRRGLLKASLAAGAVGLTSPLYLKHAWSSSGELSILNWSDELP